MEHYCKLAEMIGIGILCVAYFWVVIATLIDNPLLGFIGLCIPLVMFAYFGLHFKDKFKYSISG